MHSKPVARWRWVFNLMRRLLKPLPPIYIVVDVRRVPQPVWILEQGSLPFCCWHWNLFIPLPDSYLFTYCPDERHEASAGAKLELYRIWELVRAASEWSLSILVAIFLSEFGRALGSASYNFGTLWKAVISISALHNAEAIIQHVHTYINTYIHIHCD